MIKYASLDLAKQCVRDWNGIASSVEHLGNSGNSVFKFKTLNNSVQILRFTDLNFRSESELDGEIEYLEFLKGVSAPTCYPVLTQAGQHKLIINNLENKLLCSALTYASGEIVTEESVFWSKDFFREWGRNLAQIHQASKKFKAQPKRWDWNKELLFRQANQLITPEDKLSKEILEELVKRISTLPRNFDNFGMIHADHAPQNFHYNPENGLITAFDFGNCCYHWYIADVAISLSTVRSRVNRNIIKDELLSGYTEILSLPKDFENQIDLFIRLRVIYVYLSRLYLFGSSPTQEQKNTLQILKGKVHESKGW